MILRKTLDLLNNSGNSTYNQIRLCTFECIGEFCVILNTVSKGSNKEH
jgi:hypothetical protein